MSDYIISACSTADLTKEQFERVQKLAEERGIDMRSENLEVLDGLWDEAKAKE